MTRLSLALLGPMQVQLDGKLITLAYDKVRALLAYLALESTRPLRRDTLTALLWPQQPDKEARHNLSQALLKCRQAIDRDGTLLLTNRHTVQLNPEMEIELDTAEFETQLRHCQTHPHVRPEICADCMHCRETAVVLYQGDFLSGLSIPDSPAFDDWLVVWRERLRQQAMAALDALAHYHERRGELEPALKYARRQVTFEPWREEAQRQLMRLLLYSGQRSAALAQYKTCAHILAHELDVAPSAETQTLYEQIKTAAPHPPHNLPSQPTPFIGRQEELAHIASLLADPDCRLLTLVGPGGMGKTRLALAAAERQLRRPSDSLLPDSSTYSFFTHGVYFVSLAAVSTAASIVSAIADAIGLQLKIEHKPQKSLSSKDQLLAHLAEQRALLILDNYETFLESSTRDASIQLIIDILQAAPTVKLLVTSRQKLLLKEAFVFALDGLRFPQVDERRPLPTTAVVEYAALTLLVQCARQVQPQFSYDEEQLTQLAHICELLMGMPLAVEMAGTAAAAMPPATLASAISKSLDVLQAPWQNVPPRHRSVRAAFASSWQQLSEVERVAFANLSIFSGGFTQKAAQEITAATPETLQSLTIKSFLHYHPENGRYDIHQLLCQFGAEHLAQEPEQLTAVGDKHSRFMLHFMINANLVRDDKPDTQLWPKLRQEMKNIRSAWDWAIEREQFSLLNDCRPHLARYYNLRGPYAEAYLVFSQSIENLRAWLNAPHPEPLAGQQLLGNLLIEWTRFLKEKGLFEQITAVAQEIIALGQQCRSLSMQVSGYFYWGQALTNLRKFDTAQSKLQQGLTLANQANVPFPQAQILRQLGVLAYYGRDYDQAKTYYERALSLFRKLGNGREEAGVLNNLALVAYVHHDYKTAITIFQQAAQLYRQLGDYWGEGLALINMGNTCQQYGDYAGSRQFYEQSLPFKRRVGNRHGEGIAYVSLGLSCHRLGDYQASLRYNQQALEIAAELDDMDVRAFALTFMGHTLLTTDKLATAQEAYAEAYQIRLTRNQPQLAMEPLAGLAETLFLTGDLVQAMKWVELLYTSLSERGIAGTEEPYRLYHICFKILAANQDSRAALILEKAYADLIQCAREIPEPTIRHTFLENIAAHQAIISAHKEMKF